MRQLQLYKYSTWALLCLNIFVLLFFFAFKKPPPPPHDSFGFRRKVPKILHLASDQKALFIESATNHNQNMRRINKKQKELIQPYFQSLVDSTIHIDKEQVLDQIQLLEREKVSTTFEHFQEVKSILTPEQQGHYKRFVEHALETLLLDSRSKSKRPQRD